MRKFIYGLVALAATSIFVSELNACPSALRRSVVRERVVRVQEPARRERVVVREKIVREPVIRERIVERQSHCDNCVQEFRVERFRSSY